MRDVPMKRCLPKRRVRPEAGHDSLLRPVNEKELNASQRAPWAMTPRHAENAEHDGACHPSEQQFPV